jgi:hypothetical protein
MKFGNRFMAQDDKAGALPTLYAATQDNPRRELRRPGRLPGAALGGDGPVPGRGRKGPRKPSRRTIVHPQSWPEDLDHTGKRVIVIGSGATAATLVPTMAETGLDEHQVRRWTPCRRWTVIAMLAYALLAVLAAPNRRSIPLPPG